MSIRCCWICSSAPIKLHPEHFGYRNVAISGAMSVCKSRIRIRIQNDGRFGQQNCIAGFSRKVGTELDAF